MDPLRFINVEGHRENPMMNAVILKHLFEAFRQKEVGKFRLVSKHWNDIASRVWLRIGSYLRLQAPHMLFLYLQEVHVSPGEDDEDSNRFQDLLVMKRYPKFELHATDESYPSQVYEQFWNLCGLWLTHLTLSNFTFPDAVTFQNILVCKDTPSLVALKVEMPNVAELDEKSGSYWTTPGEKSTKLKSLELGFMSDYSGIITWKGLLTHHPHLTAFTISDSIPGNTAQVALLLDAIAEIRRGDKVNLDLKCLRLFVKDLPESLPQALRSTQLNLKEFGIKFHDGPVGTGRKGMGQSEEVINDVLSLYANTLKKLAFYVLAPMKGLRFSGMSQLRILTMVGHPIRNLQFLKDLPNLRELYLSGFFDYGNPILQTFFSSTNLTEEGGSTSSFPSIVTFGCQYCADWTTEDIIRLKKLMPNLSHLDLVFRSMTFGQVCQSWPNLENLTVFTTANARNSPSDQWLVGLVGDGEDVNFAQPNITSLQSLKGFEISQLSGSSTTLSDDFSPHSVLHGFLKLPLLERLVIDVDKMNYEVEELILSTLPFAEVYTRNSEIAE